MSRRELARRIGLNPAYLSFVLQGRRAASRRLLEGVASVLELPADYFREYRELVVIETIKRDPDLLERAYAFVQQRVRG